MPDSIVFPFFLTISLVFLVVGVVAAFMAFRRSKDLRNEMSMIVWAIVAIGCIVFGGLVWAWFLIPIILNHL